MTGGLFEWGVGGGEGIRTGSLFQKLGLHGVLIGTGGLKRGFTVYILFYFYAQCKHHGSENIITYLLIYLLAYLHTQDVIFLYVSLFSCS